MLRGASRSRHHSLALTLLACALAFVERRKEWPEFPGSSRGIPPNKHVDCWSLEQLNHDNVPAEEARNSSYGYCCGCRNDRTESAWNAFLQDERCKFFSPKCCQFYGWASELPSLPCWRDASGIMRSVEVRLGGRFWVFPQLITQPESLDALVSSVLWPSGYALAKWMFMLCMEGNHNRQGIIGARMLEIGSGLAFPSIISAWLGVGEVVATDYDRVGLAHAELAATVNLNDEQRNVQLGLAWYQRAACGS